MLVLDSMVLHKSGPRADLAHQFINFIGFGNPNRAVLPYIDPAIATNRAIFPTPDTLRRLEMLRDLGRNQRRVLPRMWTEIKMR